MSNAQFENQKNRNAAIYTFITAGLLLLLFFAVSWQKPVVLPPEPGDGIEVNLGNSEDGSGDDQPMDPSEPAPDVEVVKNSPPPDPIPDQKIEADENNNDDDEPVVKKTEPKKIEKPVVKPVTQPAEKIVSNNNKPTTTTPTPKPKAQMGKTTGGNGDGGNGAAIYKPGSNQGNGSGSGDKGKPGGDPNSNNYDGNGRGNGGSGGGSGISKRGQIQNRSITRMPSFEDDFNENANVAVDVTVAADGTVLSAKIQPRGTNTTNASIKNIALQKARQLKFAARGDEEETGTLIFNFRLRD
jgi:outer membrane biosynthesis protein TonB